MGSGKGVIKRINAIVIICVMLMGDLAGLSGITASAQAGYVFSDVWVDYLFGEEAIFHARVTPVSGIKDVYLFIQPAGESTRLEKVNLSESGEINFSYNAADHFLRPFARTDYWFRVVTQTNDPAKKEESARFYFDYIDNRESWQILEDGNIRVSWQDGDLSFGQAALNAAKTGARAALNLIPAQGLSDVKVYIYGSETKVQEALSFGVASWTAGHASPDLGIALVSITPGVDQQIEMERQIPHEIMHVYLYQIVKENYSRIPAWLNEGLASQVETFQNIDYQRAISRATKEESLIPMSALCQTFPQEASAAFLAYAQSASFIRFLQNKYSSKGLYDLVKAYQTGYSCEEGVQAALGVTFEQVEYRWKQESLGIDTGRYVAQNLAPYFLIISILLVIPFLVVGVAKRRQLT